MNGDILRLLHKEEIKLAQQVATIGQQLTNIRGEITALNGSDRVQHHTTRLEAITTRPDERCRLRIAKQFAMALQEQKLQRSKFWGLPTPVGPSLSAHEFARPDRMFTPSHGPVT